MSLVSTLRSVLPTRSLSALATLVGLGALTLGACADAPSAPASERAVPRLELVSPADTAYGLVRDQPLDKPITTTLSVPKAGGTYKLPGGLRIDVAAATFRQTTTLTVTALAGDVVAYEFQPHGLVFNKPLRMSQDLRGTNWEGKDLAQFGVGYFESTTDLNLLTKRALVKEYLRSTIDLQGQRASFDVFHFSGYMMSTGRKR